MTDQNNAANDTYSICTGAIMRTGAAGITYAGVPTATLDGGSGNESFEITSLDPTVQFPIMTGGAGRDWLFASSGDTLTDAVASGPNKEYITPI